jgi:hypothetical protein
MSYEDNPRYRPQRFKPQRAPNTLMSGAKWIAVALGVVMMSALVFSCAVNAQPVDAPHDRSAVINNKKDGTLFKDLLGHNENPFANKAACEAGVDEDKAVITLFLQQYGLDPAQYDIVITCKLEGLHKTSGVLPVKYDLEVAVATINPAMGESAVFTKQEDEAYAGHASAEACTAYFNEVEVPLLVYTYTMLSRGAVQPNKDYKLAHICKKDEGGAGL